MINNHGLRVKLAGLGCLTLVIAGFTLGPSHGAMAISPAGYPSGISFASEVSLGSSNSPCKCNLKLDPNAFIVPYLANGGTVALFKPRYEDAGKSNCGPGDCQERVAYKWTIQAVTGTPHLFNGDRETAQVQGSGRFKLCVRVRVECWSVKVSDSGHSIRVVTSCEDTGCTEFGYQ